MKCPKCKFDNADNNKFCANCGESLSITIFDKNSPQIDTNNTTNASNLHNDILSSQCNYCHGKGHIFSLSRLFLGIIGVACIIWIGLYFGTLDLAIIPLLIVGKWVWSGKSCPVCCGLGETYISKSGNANISQCISCNGKGKIKSIPRLIIFIILSIIFFYLPVIGLPISLILLYLAFKSKVCHSCSGTGIFHR